MYTYKREKEIIMGFLQNWKWESRISGTYFTKDDQTKIEWNLSRCFVSFWFPMCIFCFVSFNFKYVFLKGHVFSRPCLVDFVWMDKTHLHKHDKKKLCLIMCWWS